MVVGGSTTAVAPHVCDLEVASAFRRMVLSGQVAEAQAAIRLALYRNLPIQRVDHLPLLRRVWELREHFTPYDAAYVAIAEALDAPFLTADVRLAGAVGRFTTVETRVA